MKKLFAVLSASALFTTGGLTVQASEVETTTEGTQIELEEGAGITPDSPLYGLDKGFEKFRLWIASEDKESELLLQFAEERLSELNELDDEELTKYADQLYEEYGSNLEQVTEIIAEKVANGTATESLSKLKEKLDHTADVEQVIAQEKVAKVSQEVVAKIKDTQTKSYAVSVATELEQTQVDTLKAQGLGYGEILKLQAISQMSGKTIDELLFLDIYEEDEDEKEIDFGKLATELGIEKDAVKDQFKQYKNTMKEIKKANEKLEEELEEMDEEAREQAKERHEREMEEREEKSKKQFKAKVMEKVSERIGEFNTKIDEIYARKLAQINALNLSDEKKTELIEELDEAKEELTEKVMDKVEDGDLHPGDVGKLNAEINKEFNKVMEDITEDIELTEEELAALEQQLGNITNDVQLAVTQIINQYQENFGVVLTDEQVQLILDEMNEEVEEILEEEDAKDQQEELAEFYRELHKEVVDELKDIIEEASNDDDADDEGHEGRNDRSRGNHDDEEDAEIEEEEENTTENNL